MTNENLAAARKRAQAIRPEFPAAEIQSKRTLVGGAVQILEKPEGPHVELICSSGHLNYVFKLPKPIMRIGSKASPVPSIRCLKCSETLAGGEVRQ